jgi:hypothetical protein
MMALYKRALEQGMEINAMIEYQENNLGVNAEQLRPYTEWAIEEHSNYVANRIEIKLEDFEEFLALARQYEWDFYLDGESDNTDYIPIAEVMFRYYIKKLLADTGKPGVPVVDIDLLWEKF